MQLLHVKWVSLNENNQPKYINPGETYTYSTVITLPESISGDFQLIVKTDTNVFMSDRPGGVSTIRDDLGVVQDMGGSGIVSGISRRGQ